MYVTRNSCFLLIYDFRIETSVPSLLLWIFRSEYLTFVTWWIKRIFIIYSYFYHCYDGQLWFNVHTFWILLNQTDFWSQGCNNVGNNFDSNEIPFLNREMWISDIQQEECIFLKALTKIPVMTLMKWNRIYIYQRTAAEGSPNSNFLPLPDFRRVQPIRTAQHQIVQTVVQPWEEASTLGRNGTKISRRPFYPLWVSIGTSKIAKYQRTKVQQL